MRPIPALALLPVLLAAVPRGAVAQPARLAAVAESLATVRLTRDSVAGLVLGVYRNGRPLLRRAWGLADVEAGRALTADAALPIASITKQFTAVAVLRLVDAGRVRLDAPISTYLPELRQNGPATVRQLLNQRSGIGRYEGAYPLGTPAASAAAVVATIDAEPLEGPTGGRFAYNNANYYLLGALLARVGGDSTWDAHLARVLLAPLGLRSTRACGGDADAGVGATRATTDGTAGYFVAAVLARTGVAVGRRRGVPLPALVTGAAGALCSTADDLARWSAALHGGRVLSPASYALLTTPPEAPDGSAYAMGAVRSALDGHAKVWHEGGLGWGYNSILVHYPADSLTVVVLANTFPAAPEDTEEMLARAALGLGPRASSVAAAAAAGVRATGAALPLAAYVGRYVAGAMTFTVNGAASGAPELELLDPSNRAIRLGHVGGDVFCAHADPTFCLLFRTQGAGDGARATTLLVDSPRAKAPPARRVE